MVFEEFTILDGFELSFIFINLSIFSINILFCFFNSLISISFCLFRSNKILNVFSFSSSFSFFTLQACILYM